VSARWETATLGDVCELIARGVAPKYVEDGGILVLNQKCVRGHVVSTDFARRHDDNLRAVRPDRLIAVGDVLVNSTGTGTLGRVAQVRAAPAQPMTVDTHVTIVRPKSGKFYLDFFGYLMIVIEDQLAASGEGTSGQTELSRSALADKFMVSYPTCLDEQRRIVAVLDKAFAAIATATANAQTNLANARALLESTIEGVLAKAPNCRTFTLLETANSDCSLSYGIVQPGDELSGGMPIVRPTDLRQKFINRENLKTIDPKLAASYRRTTLRGDDLLLCVRGTTGTLSFATPELAGGNVTRGIVPIRFNPKFLSQELGYFLLRSASAQAQIKAATYGTALMQINIGDLKKLKLRVPLIDDQAELAASLNSAQQGIENLCATYSAKLTALTELNQSLLQKAFAGELTATFAQAATPAANDNYAKPMFTAQVIAFAHHRHEQKQKQRTFGHVKAQKALHLVESIGGIDLGRLPIRDAAGPNDFQHMLRATDWAVQQDFFEFVPRANGNGYEFKKLANYDACWAEAQAATKPVAAKLTRAIDLIVDSPSDFAELIATTHAAWNNLIIDKAAITDDAIVLAARDNWHDSKLKFDPSRFHDAIRFIRTNGIIPDGSATYVGGQAKLL
jgi:type I restriction enzyme, S subunit